MCRKFSPSEIHLKYLRKDLFWARGSDNEINPFLKEQVRARDWWSYTEFCGYILCFQDSFSLDTYHNARGKNLKVLNLGVAKKQNKRKPALPFPAKKPPPQKTKESSWQSHETKAFVFFSY